MTKHEHVGEITFDKRLRCKSCGKEIDSYEETISTEVSGRRALRIIKEIAQAGEYTVSDTSSVFPSYIKNMDGLVIEVTVRRIVERDYKVVKRVHYKEVISDIKGK